MVPHAAKNFKLNIFAGLAVGGIVILIECEISCPNQTQNAETQTHRNRDGETGEQQTVGCIGHVDSWVRINQARYMKYAK